MFGLSFGELVILLLVSVIVLGPKELPRYLKKAGVLAGRMRRLAYEMREKSGIDEVLRTEGIDRDIAEIRSLARGELGGVVTAVRSATSFPRMDDVPGSPYAPRPEPPPPAALPLVIPPRAHVVSREREYPPEGADSYGALPESSAVYEGELPASSLATDPVYAQGVEAQAAVVEGAS